MLDINVMHGDIHGTISEDCPTANPKGVRKSAFCGKIPTRTVIITSVEHYPSLCNRLLKNSTTLIIRGSNFGNTKIMRSAAKDRQNSGDFQPTSDAQVNSLN